MDYGKTVEIRNGSDLKTYLYGMSPAELKKVQKFVNEALENKKRELLTADVADVKKEILDLDTHGFWPEKAFTVSILNVDTNVTNTFAVSWGEVYHAINRGMIHLTLSEKF